MFVVFLLRSPSTPFYENSFSMLRNPASLFSLCSMLRNHAPLFSRLLVPLKRHISAVSLPRLLLFVEHRHAATHPPQPLGFVRHMSFICQPMAIIVSGFREITRASLVCAETCVIRHSTLPPLRAPSPRRAAFGHTAFDRVHHAFGARLYPLTQPCTLHPLRAPSPRRAAEKSSLHSLRYIPFCLLAVNLSWLQPMWRRILSPAPRPWAR